MSSPPYQYKHKPNYISAETLRSVTYKLLLGMNVDKYQTLFHNDLKRQNRGMWRDLNRDDIQRKDQATIR